MNKFICSFATFIFTIIPAFGLPYDYSSTTSLPIKLKITEDVTTKKMPIYEGQKIKFRVMNTVKYEGKYIVKIGDIIPARIENIITSGMNGFPAEITVGHFEIPNVSEGQLEDEYNAKGVNRCYWVYPLKWLMTPLYPSGSLTNFIKGGHAKVKTSDIITIYYYPEWK